MLDFFQQWSPAKCLSLAQFEGGDSMFVDNWAERSDSLADGHQEYVMVRSGGQMEARQRGRTVWLMDIRSMSWSEVEVRCRIGREVRQFG